MLSAVDSPTQGEVLTWLTKRPVPLRGTRKNHKPTSKLKSAQPGPVERSRDSSRPTAKEKRGRGRRSGDAHDEPDRRNVTAATSPGHNEPGGGLRSQPASGHILAPSRRDHAAPLH